MGEQKTARVCAGAHASRAAVAVCPHRKSLPPARGRWLPLGLLGPLGTVTAAAAAPVGLPTPLMLGAGRGPVSMRRFLRTLRTSSCQWCKGGGGDGVASRVETGLRGGGHKGLSWGATGRGCTTAMQQWLGPYIWQHNACKPTSVQANGTCRATDPIHKPDPWQEVPQSSICCPQAGCVGTCANRSLPRALTSMCSAASDSGLSLRSSVMRSLAPPSLSMAASAWGWRRGGGGGGGGETDG
jgi:hypothetical protein